MGFLTTLFFVDSKDLLNNSILHARKEDNNNDDDGDKNKIRVSFKNDNNGYQNNY
jgi:hypothetical protein